MQKLRFLMAVALIMSFSVCLTAQENGQDAANKKTKTAQKKRANKKGSDRSDRVFGQFNRRFSNVDLSDDQKHELAQLMKSKSAELGKIQKQLKNLMSPEDRKKRGAAMKQARKDGKKREAAMAAGFDAIDMSAEDQKLFVGLNKKRATIMSALQAEAKKLLTEEQLKALNAKKRKGAQATDKKKGGKKKRKGDGQDSLVQVSVKLPNMT